jgi:hypothetical protein
LIVDTDAGKPSIVNAVHFYERTEVDLWRTHGCRRLSTDQYRRTSISCATLRLLSPQRKCDQPGKRQCACKMQD